MNNETKMNAMTAHSRLTKVYYFDETISNRQRTHKVVRFFYLIFTSFGTNKIYCEYTVNSVAWVSARVCVCASFNISCMFWFYLHVYFESSKKNRTRKINECEFFFSSTASQQFQRFTFVIYSLENDEERERERESKSGGKNMMRLNFQAFQKSFIYSFFIHNPSQIQRRRKIVLIDTHQSWDQSFMHCF